LEAERQARRERMDAERNLRMNENRKAMQETLGLSDAQTDAVEQVLAQQREDAFDLQSKLRSETDPETRRETLKSFEDARRARLAEILDEKQLETFLIHGALVARRAGVAVAARRPGVPAARMMGGSGMHLRGRMGISTRRSNMQNHPR
jgi:hypothetical protein